MLTATQSELVFRVFDHSTSARARCRSAKASVLPTTGIDAPSLCPTKWLPPPPPPPLPLSSLALPSLSLQSPSSAASAARRPETVTRGSGGAPLTPQPPPLRETRPRPPWPPRPLPPRPPPSRTPLSSSSATAASSAAVALILSMGDSCPFFPAAEFAMRSRLELACRSVNGR